jgi:hypothetical protein
MSKIINIIIFFIIILTFIGCGHSKPMCITKQSETLQIRWGERNIKTGFTQGFLLFTNCELFRINKKSDNEELLKLKIGKIENSNYCSILSLAQRVIMRNLTLSIPADTVRFIEYENPAARVFIVAEWNPKYSIPANSEYRMLYDSLQALTKENK